MKIGFICPDAPGHVNPMTALARHVVARNNEVVFLYSSGARGLPYIPYEDDEFQAALNEVSKKQGKDALQFAMHVVMAQTEMIMKSLPRIVQDNKIEALVIDNISM